MKKLFIFIIFIYLTFFIYNANAILVPALWFSSWSQFIWKVVFPESNASYSWVYVNTDNFVLDNTTDMKVTWNFRLKNLSSSWDPSLWWATFDIWIVPSAPSVVLKNNLDNTFTFSWYAWSKAAWWIYFSPVLLKDEWWVNISNSKVIYDRWYNDGEWKITGCAWSQNIWWICFDWITLDTTPPHLFGMAWTLSIISSASNNKTISLNETSTVEIQNCDSLAYTKYYDTITFTHNMRNAWINYRDYNIKAEDIYWNTATWTIKIVANIPLLNSINLSWSLWIEKIADWKDEHTIDIKLRDTYWNPVIPVSWIKNVSLTVWFENNVDKIQNGSEYDLWDAINFSSTDFPLLFWWIWETEDTASKTDWNYKVDFTSIAPTKAWYIYSSSSNDIKVNKLDINISALNWNLWVWEWNYTNLHNTYYSNNFKFTPTVKINWINNSDNWLITRDNETNFTISWTIQKTSWSSDLIDLKITNIYDIMSWSVYKNYYMNFQNLSSTWAWNPNCMWFKTLTWYYYTTLSCDKTTPWSSNLVRNYWNITINNSNFENTLKTLPRVISAWLSKFDTRFSSLISYTINWSNVIYPSYWTTSSIINSQIKVSWITNANNNNFNVVDDTSINYIWNISKMDAYTQIHKNVAIFQKTWAWNTNTLYKTWDYTIPSAWPIWIDTIIVDSWDIIIENDILKNTWKIKTIIALKKTDWTKWNIWIKDNVQYIWATLIADRSIISWDWTNYYNDTNSALNQLFIKWSVISYNTIWWASSTPTICPYYLDKSNCTLLIAKRYDLNHFRNYIHSLRWNPVNFSLYWINISEWYLYAPMIIEYDSDLQTNPPSILKK